MAKERASAATVFSQCNISFRKSTQRQLPSHTTKLSGWGELTCRVSDMSDTQNITSQNWPSNNEAVNY